MATALGEVCVTFRLVQELWICCFLEIGRRMSAAVKKQRSHVRYINEANLSISFGPTQANDAKVAVQASTTTTNGQITSSWTAGTAPVTGHLCWPILILSIECKECVCDCIYIAKIMLHRLISCKDLGYCTWLALPQRVAAGKTVNIASRLASTSLVSKLC